MTDSQNLHTSSNGDFQAEDDFVDYGNRSACGRAKTKRLILNLLARWYCIALGLLLGFTGATFYLSKIPNKYSATTTLLIKQQADSLMGRNRMDEIDLRSMEGLNTAAEQVRRFELLERVASRIDVRSLPGIIPPPIDWRPDWFTGWHGGPAKTYTEATETGNAQLPAPEELSGWLASMMQVSVRRGTRLVDITFEHQIPNVAKTLADAVAREHLAALAGAVTEGRTSESYTLIKQSEEARLNLQEAQSALAKYNRAIELHEALVNQENINSQLARRYLGKHPKMIAAQGQLKELETRFLNEFNVAILSPVDQKYWQTASLQLEAVKDDIAAYLSLARQLLLARTGVLKGETATNMAVFNSILTRIEESNINRQGDESSIEINSFARLSGGPTSPNRNKIRLVGTCGGSLFGLAIAFLLIRINNKFHCVAQIEEETGLPVLAAISNISIRHLDEAARKYFRRNKSEIPDPQKESWDPHLIFRPGISSTIFAEMFRILRASVSLLGDETRRKITLFSSALPGEGKSIISSNFALAAAAQGRKTLLIDLDLRRPSIHRIFGILRSERGPGITELLAGRASFEESIHRKAGCENLHLILSGHRAPNPGELLNLTHLKKLFSEAREKYDVVIVDSAPLLPVPDTRVIATLVDNFCLVARANYVPKGALNRTLDLLQAADTLPSGLVFNGFKETRHMIGENYSYGSYRHTSYGRPYQYGYGSYGAYGTVEEDCDKEILKRKGKSKRKNKASIEND